MDAELTPDAVAQTRAANTDLGREFIEAIRAECVRATTQRPLDSPAFGRAKLAENTLRVIYGFTRDFGAESERLGLGKVVHEAIDHADRTRHQALVDQGRMDLPDEGS